MAALTRPPLILKLLADDIRWQIVTALARSDRRGQELAQLLKRPQNLVSYHLKQLEKAKLIRERRSAADGREFYFSLRLDQVLRLLSDSGQALHPAFSGETGAQDQPAASVEPPVRVLFLCTHNSARSQMAEAILRHLSRGQVEAYSAGNEPSSVHPLALQTMRARGIAIDGQRSKHLSEFVGQRFDYVVTVCDNARESCPVFPGDPERIHWSFEDPSALTDREARERAFSKIATELTTRINYLLLLIHRHQRGDLNARGE